MFDELILLVEHVYECERLLLRINMTWKNIIFLKNKYKMVE